LSVCGTLVVSDIPTLLEWKLGTESDVKMRCIVGAPFPNQYVDDNVEERRKTEEERLLVNAIVSIPQ
jgi:hypothetical protein